jgi:hypothetical protein
MKHRPDEQKDGAENLRVLPKESKPGIIGDLLALFVIAVAFAENAATIGLTVKFQVFAYLDAFLPAGPEVKVAKRYVFGSGHAFTDFLNDFVALVGADEQRSCEAFKSIFAGVAGSLTQPELVAGPATVAAGG